MEAGQTAPAADPRPTAGGSARAAGGTTALRQHRRAALLEDLRAWFARHIVVVAQTDLRLLALWAAHTFLCHELTPPHGC